MTLVGMLGCASAGRRRPEPAAPAVGAVPIPGTYAEAELRLAHRDVTVKLSDLPKPDAAWRERASISYTGRVSFALHIAEHEFLELTVVDTVTETESGYQGGIEDFRLGGADTHEQLDSGNAFPARDWNPETGEATGPLMFAVRLLPRTGAPESERRQVVVYKAKQTIFVAEKLVTAEQWTPRLRIEAPRASEIVPIHPGWH